MLFEMEGIPRDTAREALRLASHKLSVNTQFCERRARITGRLIDHRRALRGRRVVDLEWLIGVVYEQLAPGMFERIASGPARFHALATEVESGELIDLHRFTTEAATVPLALRASAALPILCGPPVELDGMRLLDAGLTASVPFRRAIDDGATHVLVLRSHPDHPERTAPGRLARWTVGRALARVGPTVVEAWASRAVRETADEELLAEYERGERDGPAVAIWRPPAEAPIPSRLERDSALVSAALEAARAGARAAFDPVL
jgi:predicted patatin/cPLA2 family phospholipase